MRGERKRIKDIGNEIREKRKWIWDVNLGFGI